MSMVENKIGKGWLPVSLSLDANPPSATWMEFGSTPLSKPFFEDSVLKLENAFPPVKKLTTNVEAILAAGGQWPTAAPEGLIFHISRCGSTLLANALRLREDLVVVSEAEPITGLLDPYAASKLGYRPDQWLPLQAKLLESLATLFAHYRSGKKERVIIKFASWNILSWAAIRRIWPDIPCIVLIRDPVEVMISNLTMSIGWMKHKTYPLDPGDPPVTGMRDAEYCARMIGKLCEAGIQVSNDNCRVLDYGSLNAATIRDAAAFLKVELPRGDHLGQVLRVDAKDPRQRRPFRDDREKKQQSATESMRRAVLQWASEPYTQLKERESREP
jgi:hypothetical protein